MNFLIKLDALMHENNINKSVLSKESGVPYTTIDGFYKKGFGNAKLSTIKKIAEYFDTTLDYLMRDDVVDKNFGKSPLHNNEIELTTLYNKLNEEGQEKLLDYADDLVSSGKYKKT